MYSKLDEDYVMRTRGGGTVSVVVGVVVALLVLSEVSTYLSTREKDRLRVDPTFKERMVIDLDISFLELHCGEVTLDVMDVTGEQYEGLDHDIKKTRVDVGTMEPIGDALPHAPGDSPSNLPEGYCGSCYGAETETRRCCNTCESVRQAYLDKGWSSTTVVKSAEQCIREGVVSAV
jgi:hypothetical protein